MKLFIIIVFMFSFSLCHAQYIDNKLNIEINAGLFNTINNENYTQNDYQYPSLFGSYPNTFDLGFGFNYKLSSYLWLGADYHSHNFDKWEGQSDLFILENPKSKIKSYMVNMTFLPIGKKANIGVLIGLGQYQHNLSWDNTNNTSTLGDTSNYVTNYSEKNLELKTGLVYYKDLNMNFGINLKAIYSYKLINNLYLSEEYLHGINLSIGLYYRLLKNRYYNYE